MGSNPNAEDFPSGDVRPPSAEDVWSHEQYVRLESLTQAVNHSRGRGTQWDVIRVANDFANWINHGEGVEGVAPNAEDK